MKKRSIWKDTIKEKSFKKLDKNCDVDVLIIGGGITGASVYYQLKDTNLKVMLVEQNKIGMGVTANSTGKLTFMQNDLIDKIRNSHGDSIASMYLKSQIEASLLVNDIIKKEKIDCDLEKVPSIIYTNNDKEVKKLQDLKKFFEDNKININNVNLEIVKSKYAITYDNTYIFHPIKFVYGLLDNGNIYEDTSILKITEESGFYLCYTSKYQIKTKWVIIASHYPYFNIPFMFPLKGSIEKSYLSASKYLGNKISLISYSNPFISIRTYHDYLVYLSNSHTSCNDTDDLKNFQELKKKLSDLKLKPDYLWSNMDIMTNDYMPYIGEIKDKMLIATGYNTWGLACSVLAGKILKDIIMDINNPYIELFNPNRINVDKLLGNFSSSYKSIKGYMQGISSKNKAYTCPHMGCKLIYNEEEKTYDCPCHGSRFDNSGKCISAPSNKNIIIKK